MNLQVIQNNGHIVRREGFLIGHRTSMKWNRYRNQNILRGDIFHNELVIGVCVAVYIFITASASAGASASANVFRGPTSFN